jgi:hypothetical protein
MNTTCWIGSRTTGDGETDGGPDGDLEPGADGVLDVEDPPDPEQAAKSAATTPMTTHGKGHPRICTRHLRPIDPERRGSLKGLT